MITIKKAEAEFIREPLLGPFGFKGKYVDELWQIAVRLQTENNSAVGLGVQSILWSDSSIFAQNCPSGGNAIMFAMTNYAVKLATGYSFHTPEDLLDYLLPKVLDYGKIISGNPNMRTTFALNSLVPLDFAAWILYAKENDFTTFDDIIPDDCKLAMNFKNEKISRIPLITYNFNEKDIKNMMDQHDFFLKIKIGSDPDGDNDYRKMVEWDKQRICLIHNIAKNTSTPYTENGNIPYYLDANGRYPNKDLLLELLDYADQIGALERIVLLEEPFDELNEVDVHDLPVRVTADESAHCEKDVAKRIQMGYQAIALKPIAKTLSMSFRILKIAHQKNIPCFCADLTVNPLMLEWNKNFAARLQPLPQMKIGVIETNGHQNYQHWEAMESCHPYSSSKFTRIQDGVYHLDNDFYTSGGGIFENSSFYNNFFKIEKG